MQLHHQIDAIRAAGAELHVIGSGSPSFLAGFREETGWAGPLYTDPSLAVFKAAELKRSVVKTLDPRSLFGAAKALAGGHRQGSTQGDTWQQGGVLVIAKGGGVKWRHASERPGDNAPPDEIITALGTLSTFTTF